MPAMDELRGLLGQPQKIVITTHYNPDGDAIGSSLGLCHYLRGRGHNVCVITPNEYANYLHFLPGDADVLVHSLQPDVSAKFIADADILFMLDFNDLSRVPGISEQAGKAKATRILIDHHLQPQVERAYEWWATDVSSTAELVYSFIVDMGGEGDIDKDIASCLYAGICADTNRFAFNVSEQVHLVAARLVGMGVDVAQIVHQLFGRYSENRLRLLGFSLTERMLVFPGFRAAIIHLSQADLNGFNYQKGDTEGMVNYALGIEGVKFATLIKEYDGKVKMSFRSRGDFSVNDFARKHFNGGGHKNAAGGRSDLGYTATIEKMVDLLPLYAGELNNMP